MLLAFLIDGGTAANEALYVGTLLAFGFGLLCAGLFLTWRLRALGGGSRSWPTAYGTITSSRVAKHDADGIEKFIPTVTYDYTVAGKTYAGDRLRFGAYAGTRQKAQQDVDRYPVGTRVNVRYAPRQPQTSTLEAGAAGVSAPGLALAAGGAALIVLVATVATFT